MRFLLSLCLATVSLKAAGLPIEQIVTPAGHQVWLPRERPKAIALSPDGRWLVTAGSSHQLSVLDPATGQTIQSLSFPGATPAQAEASGDYILSPDEGAALSFNGLVFSPDGTRLFASDVNGSIKFFAVAPSGLRPNGTFPLPAAAAPRRHREIPAGLALSGNGSRLYVAANLSNELLELDAKSGDVLRQFPMGVAPFAVVLSRESAYVSNWGGRRPQPGDVVGPAGQGTAVRVDPVRFAASEGSVSVIDLKAGKISAEIVTGRHASGLALSPDGRYLVVANASEDTLSVIATASNRIVENISLRWQAGDLFGASPNAVAFDAKGQRLYVCAGTQNAVAVVRFRPGNCQLEGLIPTGWYPGAIVFDPARRQLAVANLKGDGREDPGPGGPGGYRTRGLEGSLSLIPLPPERELREMTRTVLTNYRRSIITAALLPPRAVAPCPIPERAGEPSVFRHVIYVIKENRTYDQVLGDLKPGDGDPTLCVYGASVTPNLHKIARDFALLDNTYCAGILSADGHQWATAALASDYVEKSFGAWPRSYPFGGDANAVDALAYSPAGFIWDNALAHHVTVRNYGEFMLTQVTWANGQRGTPSYAEINRAYRTGSGADRITCKAGVESLAKVSQLDTAGWNLNISDQFRVDRFLAEFQHYELTGDLPALIVLYLPQDHTHGLTAGLPSPAACAADNDLAMGRVVEALSHSRYWKDTCLLAIEDDPQDGWDHVSGYRTTAYVASAYTRRHAIISTKYTQPGLLRTIELILGLPPMNQLDAAALPWRDCFQPRFDPTPFTAVPNQVPLDQLSPPLAQLKNQAFRKDEVISAGLPFDVPDQCPEEVLNQILWRAARGTQVPYPQWAVLKSPRDDDDEDDR